MTTSILTEMATEKRKCSMSFMFLVGVILVHLIHNVNCDVTEMEGNPDEKDETADEKADHSSWQSCEKDDKEPCSGGSGESIDTGDYSTADQLSGSVSGSESGSESGSVSGEGGNDPQKVAEADDETEDIEHVSDPSSVESGVNNDVDNNVEEKEKIDDVGETEQKEENIPLPATENDTETETNSTIIQWIKYLIDPFLEEFRDGIYSNISDKSNQTETNSSDIHSVELSNITETNVTEPVPANITEALSENVTDSSKKVKFQCTGRNITDETNATVKVITSAKFLQLLTFERNETDNSSDCLVVMFYAPWCQFCAKTAPHYNALARAYPQLDFVAVDTAQFSNILARFGTVYVPNILVFHQSRAAVKFNHTEREFNTFVSFIKNTTGMEPNVTVNVTELDYTGPVPSVPTDDPDYLLLVSWIFVIFCSTCMFVKSHKGQQWIARVRVLWQEHQHID